MSETRRRPEGFDSAAAVTRSLLGYGVAAGVFYLGVGLVLALTRDGFDLSRHALSLLMLGDYGWLQRGNLLLTGLMTVAAAVGFARALAPRREARRAGVLLSVFGVSLVMSGIFPPDAMEGFPPEATIDDDPSLTGILHLAFGGIGFLALAAAAVSVGGWFASREEQRWASYSRGAAVLVIAGFVGGAALATYTAGIALLWLAVVAGWAWLAGASVQVYRTVPHPDRRDPKTA